MAVSWPVPLCRSGGRPPPRHALQPCPRPSLLLPLDRKSASLEASGPGVSHPTPPPPPSLAGASGREAEVPVVVEPPCVCRATAQPTPQQGDSGIRCPRCTEASRGSFVCWCLFQPWPPVWSSPSSRAARSLFSPSALWGTPGHPPSAPGTGVGALGGLPGQGQGVMAESDPPFPPE